MKVLAISSSRVGNGGFLENALPLIKEFIDGNNTRIAFIPFASVQREYGEYGEMVKQALTGLGIDTVIPENAKTVIDRADVIMVGGGNTFKLLHDIYDLDLFHLIQSKVKNGTAYIGWSAGANLAGRSICTTNDMPIIQPRSFEAFGFLPFQINPHYINQKLEGHNGETRDQRLEEFVALNPGIPVIGIPEGTALQLNDSSLKFIGAREGVFLVGDSNKQQAKRAIGINEDLSFLL